MKKSCEVYERDMMGLRAGRANPKLLDRIMVDYYGTSTPIPQIGQQTEPGDERHNACECQNNCRSEPDDLNDQFSLPDDQKGKDKHQTPDSGGEDPQNIGQSFFHKEFLPGLTDDYTDSITESSAPIKVFVL